MKQGRIVYTATPWAGAVMSSAGAVMILAGAVMIWAGGIDIHEILKSELKNAKKPGILSNDR